MSEEHMVPMRYYVVRLTPPQLALVSEALHAYSENRSVDLTEIEDTTHRQIVRTALDIRKMAIRDLITVMDRVVIDELDHQPGREE
jgi:hypothetical protein